MPYLPDNLENMLLPSNVIGFKELFIFMEGEMYLMPSKFFDTKCYKCQNNNKNKYMFENHKALYFLLKSLVLVKIRWKGT